MPHFVLNAERSFVMTKQDRQIVKLRKEIIKIRAQTDILKGKYDCYV